MDSLRLKAPCSLLGRLLVLNMTNMATLFASIIICIFSQLDGVAAEDGVVDPNENGGDNTLATIAPEKEKAGNGTDASDSGGDNGLSNMMYDSGMLRRSFYVLIGFTLLTVVFFAYRWMRSRGKRKTKKYGVLATRSSDMELRPLDQEDDEEDMTVFDVNAK